MGEEVVRIIFHLKGEFMLTPKMFYKSVSDSMRKTLLQITGITYFSM